MSGKLVLSITGIQDEFISKNPTFSHFLSVFKKHTKFAFNTIEIPLVNARLGEETQCIIPLDAGDLINTLTLRWKLYYKASINSEHFTGSVGHGGYSANGGTYDNPFTDHVGIHGIDYAELYIGGTLIEKITGDWIYLYNKYHSARYIFTDAILHQTESAQSPYGSTSKVISTDPVTTTTVGIQEVADLQPTGGSSIDDFAEDHQMSFDGDTLVVGADAVTPGAVYVFMRNTAGDTSSGWTQTQRLTSSSAGADGFGMSVSINGNTLVVGLPDTGAFYFGRVEIFTRNAANQNFVLRHTIEGDTSLYRPYFGYSVSLDGDTLAVGTWRSGRRVYIYTRTPGNISSAWTLRDTTVFGTNSIGFRVSLSGDRVAIGSESGVVYVYQRDTLGDLTSTWSQEFTVNGNSGVDNLGSASHIAGNQFGEAVSLDGDTLVIGRRRGSYVYSTDIYLYRAFVYTRNSSLWEQTAILEPIDGAQNNYFGESVSVKNDLIAIGASGDSNGKIYIYTRDTPGDPSSTWSSTTTLIPSTGSYGGDSVVTDGTTIISGDKARHAHVFVNTTTTTTSYAPVLEHQWNLKQMHIDLPFYFYNNLPASILSCKITKQNCYVKVKFKPFDKLVHPFLLPYTNDTNIESASLLTKFTFLDHDELNFLKSKPIKQLITQTNLHQHDIIRQNEGHDHTTEIPLNLANPVKNIHFFTVKKSRLSDLIKTAKSRIYTPNVFDSIYLYMYTIPFLSAGLKINANYIFDESYVKLTHENSLINSRSAQAQPLATYGGTYPKRISGFIFDESGSYSFALYPFNNEPSGHLNFSRIIDQKFTIDPGFTTTTDGHPSNILVADNVHQVSVGDTLEVNIYSTSYNIMVYSSGLCGLKY